MVSGRYEDIITACAAEITGHGVGCQCDDCEDYRSETLVGWIEHARYMLDRRDGEPTANDRTVRCFCPTYIRERKCVHTDAGFDAEKTFDVTCAQCQVPMRMLGNNPFHYGCPSCGATHLYADPADPPPGIARLRRVLAEAESRQYGDEVLTFDGFEDTPDATLLLSDIAALLALVDGAR